MRAQNLRLAILAGAAAIGAAVTLTGLSALASAPPERILWQVDADRGYSADVVQLTFTGEMPGGRSMISSPSSLNVLEGLTAAQLNGDARQPVSFHVLRDAGQFDCQGFAQGRHASGECQFRGSQSFAQLLASRGAGRADNAELYRMTVHNVGANYLDELKSLHYPTPTVEEPPETKAVCIPASNRFEVAS